MHYQIDNFTIKSENAALSNKQTNKNVLKKIETLSNHMTALDYGCGKLRYTIPLSKTVNDVVAIDSPEQLDRKQVIDGIKTTIRDYVLTNNKINVFEINSQEWLIKRYDFILCTNVLSTIPFHQVRLNVLKNIESSLKDDGEAFISVQYRNSYFKEYGTRQNATCFYDGWILTNKNSRTFYGLILPEKLKELCFAAGLNIKNLFLDDGSAFITATKKK